MIRMLPVLFPKQDMAKWTRLFNNFIWDYKRHHIAHKILQKSQNRGSLGIPDIPLYYAAANLSTVLWILNTTGDMDWMKIETANSNGYSKQDTFCLPLSRRKTLQLTNRFLEVTLNIWDKWKRKLVWCYSPQMTLGSIEWLMDDLDHLMKTWKTTAPCKLKDVLQNKAIYRNGTYRKRWTLTWDGCITSKSELCWHDQRFWQTLRKETQHMNS